MKRLISLLIICVALSGCTLHYQNQKGFKATGKDFKTKEGTIEKGKVHFRSKLEIWIPWKPKKTNGKI